MASVGLSYGCLRGRIGCNADAFRYGSEAWLERRSAEIDSSRSHEVVSLRPRCFETQSGLTVPTSKPRGRRRASMTPIQAVTPTATPTSTIRRDIPNLLGEVYSIVARTNRWREDLLRGFTIGRDEPAVIESSRSAAGPAATDSRSAHIRCISSRPCCPRTDSSWRPSRIGRTDTMLARGNSMGLAKASLS